MIALLLLFACGGPQTAEDCIPTTGDNCSCQPQCLTEEQIRWEQRNGICAMDCMFESTWTCGLEDGQCVVIEE